MKLLRILTIAFFLSLTTLLQAQQQFIIQSKYLSVADTSWYFIPQGEAAIENEKLPALILLHGHGGDFRTWNEITPLQTLANKHHIIIICPDGLTDSWYLNSPIQDNSQWEHFFTQDFLPYLRKNLNIDTNSIFIDGLSMGGHGAMYLFLKHPQWFLAAGSTSGTLNLHASSLKNQSLSQKLGPYNENLTRFTKFSALGLLENLKGTRKPFIFDCGNKDRLLAANIEFKTQCDRLDLNCFFFSMPGGHNAEYWKESLQWHLIFFEKILESKSSNSLH